MAFGVRHAESRYHYRDTIADLDFAGSLERSESGPLGRSRVRSRTTTGDIPTMTRKKIPDTNLYVPQIFLYCGPTVLSTITGLDYYKHIRPEINRQRYRKANAGVTGMRNSELTRVLYQLGWLAGPIRTVPGARPLELFERFPDGVRLGDALAAIYQTGGARRDSIMVVETNRHWVTVQSNVVVDNHAIDSLIRHPARRQWAKRAWKIVPFPHWVQMIHVRGKQYYARRAA